MTVHIVGLGPAGPELLTQETAALLASGRVVILRTRHHPAAAALPDSSRLRSCDDIDAAAGSRDEAAEAIASLVLEATGAGDVVFAVPGSPALSDSSVAILRERAAARGIDVVIHPAVGPLDTALTALEEDVSDLQLCNPHSLRIDPQRPALVRLGEVVSTTALKKDLLGLYPASHPCLHLPADRRGTVRRGAIADLESWSLTPADMLFLPPLAPEEDVNRLEGLAYIVRRLQAPDGCPWDREQTHASLRHHLLEETYECLEAIDSGDRESIVEELGDVLLQVLMHAAVAEREGEFSLGDVTSRIATKLIRRHPHVFGEADVDSAQEAWENWDVLKREEAPTRSILEGVPSSLPALAASQALQSRARRAGFDWPDVEGPIEKLAEELAELARAGDAGEREDEFGDVLFVITNIADHLDIDAEQALRAANHKFRSRFRQMEKIARERDMDLTTLDLDALNALWEKAKGDVG